VAVDAFTHDGPHVPLDVIAKNARVGIGSLYRHLPTRRRLVEAAYRNELACLCDSADDLLATATPEAALRKWMGRFIVYLTTKHGMAYALRAVIASGGNPFEQSRTRAVAGVAQLGERRRRGRHHPG
jgi:AcrR family transcriptional regulator